ncbi:hypothetical protein Glove_281g45 [Diversispora epigaea]|uniref:Uncharacterized protein n=1 Tax=Diversispora epigaea TaxID=1348612 RepID=A0A397I920_9GLOM|nr:hypothetical protein Glove_281g45 [Diversispora epigaea]
MATGMMIIMMMMMMNVTNNELMQGIIVKIVFSNAIKVFEKNLLIFAVNTLIRFQLLILFIKASQMILEMR